MAQDRNENGREFGISFSDGKFRENEKLPVEPAEKQTPPVSESGAYLDELENDHKDLQDIKAADSKKLSPKDKKIISLLAVLDVLVFAFIGVYLYVSGSADEYDIEDAPSIVAYDPANAFYGELDTYIRAADFPADMQSRFKRLYSENNDSAGWIRIDGTSIDYPVLRAEDNSKYERADFYGEFDRRGSIFMDYRNKLGKGRSGLSKVTILWGHHLTEDMTIFADLEKYLDVEYYKEHPVIEMDNLFDDYKWKIFACFTANVEPEDDNGEVFYYWDPYISDNDTDGFVNECINRSWFVNPAVDFNATDKLLCLSTCTYILNKYDYHEVRTVIMARLVRNGEDSSVDVSGAYQNENRRMPQLYYDINGLSNPYAGIPCWKASY